MNKKSKSKIKQQVPSKELLSINEFTIQDILNNDTVKEGISTFAITMRQSSENRKAEIELQRKHLETELEHRKFDIREQELEQKHIKLFDIRNKIYNFLVIVVSIVTTIVLTNYNILDKGDAKTIIIFILSLGITGNIGFIKRLFTKRKNQ